MLFRRASPSLSPTVAQQADRFIKTSGVCALEIARHAAQASQGGDRCEFWTRVLAQVEFRSGCRLG